MDYENAVVNLDVLFDRNPAYGNLYATAIEACEICMAEPELVELIGASKTGVSQIQDGASVLATLIRRGGIERSILVNGETYEGTLEDLQNDETLPDEINVEFLVQATAAGLDTAAAYRERTSPQWLFSENPQFVDGYELVLTMCSEADGQSTKDLQAALIEAGIVKPGVEGAQELHASYFTSKLEKHGALVWDRKRWRTSPKGAEILNASE